MSAKDNSSLQGPGAPHQQPMASQTFLDSLPFMAMLLRPGTREIVACNQPAIDGGAVRGRTCFQTVADNIAPCLWCQAPALWETGKRQHAEAVLLGRDVEASWHVVNDDLYLHFIDDITERKAAESHLRKRLQALSAELAVTEERHRQKVAADLHDGICQNIYAIKLWLERMQMGLSKDEHRRAVAEAISLATEAMARGRDMTRELCPPILQEAGLGAALAWLADVFTRKSSIQCNVAVPTEQGPVNGGAAGLLFQATRELLANVSKHADAKNVAICLSYQGRTVIVTVEDDGIGFDFDVQGAGNAPPHGFGLFSIRQRLVGMDGRLEVARRQAGGAVVRMILPMDSG